MAFLSDRDDYGPEKPSKTLYHWAEGDEAAAASEGDPPPPRGPRRGWRSSAADDV